MFASIRYINTHHAASSIPEQQFPIHFPGQTPLNASSLPTQQPHELHTNINNTTTTQPPYTNGNSNSHTHQNGTTSVPGSIPSTPAALRDGFETPRPQTPNPNNTTTNNNTPAPQDQDQQHDANTTTNTSDNDEIARPDTPTTFLSALHELSRDLVTKEQQIEFLINNLPGRDRTVEEQEARIRELDAELRTLDTEVERAEMERRGMLERVEGVIMGVRRW